MGSVFFFFGSNKVLRGWGVGRGGEGEYMVDICSKTVRGCAWRGGEG